MSLIDSLRNVFKKQATYSVTSRSTWQDYTVLADSDNYFDQFFGWTYKAIKTVADATIRHEIKLAQGDLTKYDILQEKENDLLRDLHRFNGYQTLTEARWLTLAHKRLVGSAYWLIVKSEENGFRYEFYILNPMKMSLKVDNYGLPKMYQYTTPDGAMHDIEPNDLIIFKDPNPADWLKGYSVLQASRLSHNSYELAMKFNMNVFGNMGNPEGFLVMDGVSPDSRKRVEKQLRQKFGTYKNAGKIGVLNKLAQWLPITTAPRDLQFKENILIMRDELLSFHGVPRPLVGITDSTYANSFEAQKIFQQYTLHPELLSETDVYNEQLLRKYYKIVPMPKNIFFVCPNPVEADLKSMSEQAVALYQGGIIKKNEARKMVNQDPDEKDGDSYYTQAQPNAIPPEVTTPAKSVTKEESKSIDEKVFVKTDIQQKGEALKSFFFEKSIANESIYEKTTQQYFNDQLGRVLSQLKPQKAVEGIDVSFVFNVVDEAKFAEDFFDATVSVIAKRSLKVANDMIEGKYQIPDYAKETLKRNLEKFSVEINATTQDDLGKIIATAVETGDSYDTTAKKIKDLFNEYSVGTEKTTQSRAKRIAITETNSIANEVYRSTYVQSEIVKGMQWLTAHDKDVRDAHEAVDFTTVVKGTKFLVGGEYLAYPGDKSGSAENVINCRCTLIPVIK